MEARKVPKEKQGTQVQEAGKYEDHLKLGQQHAAVNALVRFHCEGMLCEQVIHHDAVRDVVHQRHEEDPDDQSEEEFVVLTANTVVKPSTMVIKSVDAAITGTTVLGGLVDVRLAHVTLVLMVCTIELFAVNDEQVTTW